MARKLRLEYEVAIYHLMNRSDRRKPIFRDDSDRLLFLDTFGQACAKSDWQVHAYCLMSNHFHLVVETPKANLVAGMTWFLGTYTNRFNRKHKLFGHLFSGRYKSLFVDGSGNGTLAQKRKGDPVKIKIAQRLRAETDDVRVDRRTAGDGHKGTPGPSVVLDGTEKPQPK